MHRNSFVVTAMSAALLLITTSQARSELLCDCAQVIDSCDASVSLSGSRVNIESSSQSCSRVDYLIEGQPYTALVVGGSGELAGPALPMRDASVVVENCRVCAETGQQKASAAAIKTAEEPDEDAGKLRSVIKVMPDYPRSAWMNKLEGDVLVEFSVNTEGAVTNIKVLKSTGSSFDLAVIDAVSRFKYAPAEEDGIAVGSSGVKARFQFRMLDNGATPSVTSDAG
jgi:TonB family protein